MGFSERAKQFETEMDKECAICHVHFGPRSYKADHSSAGLHLEMKEINGEDWYVVTETPEGHKNLIGKKIHLHAFGLNGKEEGDRVRLCHGCHVDVGNEARAEAKRRNPNFTGNVPPPAVLYEVTMFSIEMGMVISPSFINDAKPVQERKIKFVFPEKDRPSL